MSGTLGAAVAAASAGLAVLAVSQGWHQLHALPIAGRPASGLSVRSALAGLGGSALARPLRPRTRSVPAGGRDGWTVEMVSGARLVGGLVAALLLLAPPPLPILAVPAGASAFVVPAFGAARGARRRSREATLELPLFLDLLSVATSAGLAPQLAVRHAVEPTTGPLAAELGSAIRGAELGGRWRDQLEAATERLDLPDLRRAVALIRRTETYGSSLGEEMARLAADVREERRSRATERARAAPVKMLFPLVFLILPAFLLLTVVPVLLTTVRSIG